MSKAFSRQTKLPNIVGRSQYISDTKRQEHIVFYSNEHMISDWQEYADFEKQNRKNKQENIQGREIIIALPNELDQDLTNLKNIVDEYAINTVGNDREFEYAVHWNKEKTNLHAHIIYSERKRATEQKAKTYRSDMWFNKDTGKLAKANSDNAELRFKKGDVQKDEKGNVRYENNMFTTKDREFKSNDFNDKLKENLAEVLNKYGYASRVFDQSIELPQAKLYQGARADYIEKARKSNQLRAEYNKIVVKAVKEKIMPITMAIMSKENIMKKVKEENSKSQSISMSGIDYIRESIKNLKAYIQDKLQTIKNVMEYQKEKALSKKPELTPIELKIKEMEINVNQAKEERLERIKVNDESIESLETKIKENSTISFTDKKVMRVAKSIDDLNIPIQNYESKTKEIEKVKRGLKRVEEGYKNLKFYDLLQEKPLRLKNIKLQEQLVVLEKKLKDTDINKLKESMKTWNKELEKLNKEREEVNKENRGYHQSIHKLQGENTSLNEEISERDLLLKERIYDLRNPEVAEQKREIERQESTVKKINTTPMSERIAKAKVESKERNKQDNEKPIFSIEELQKNQKDIDRDRENKPDKPKKRSKGRGR